MHKIFHFDYSAPWGNIRITSYPYALLLIDLIPQNPVYRQAQTVWEMTIFHQLNSYFSDPKHSFTLPLHLEGSDFQKQVLQTIKAIPCGETRYYSDLANALDSAPRAIGGACRRNPIPIIIPCHRVVAKRGLGGFCGTDQKPKVAIKQWLLQHETH